MGGLSGSLKPGEWVRHMPRPPLASSEALPWQGIDVYRFKNPRRFELSMPAVGAHFVVAHLRNPAQMNARWNGRWSRARTIPGRIMIVPAHQDTLWDWEGEIDELQIFLQPDVLQRTAEELDHGPVTLVDGIAIEDPQIWQIAQDLRAELAAPGAGTRLFADTAAQRLALALLRGHSSLRGAALGDAAPERATALAPYRLRRALEYIEASLEHDLSLADIARAAGLSEFHFARGFKAATGTTPHRYLNDRRLQRAQDLLRTTAMPIAQVAVAAGFGSQSRLTTALREARGMTPKRYRDLAAD